MIGKKKKKKKKRPYYTNDLYYNEDVLTPSTDNFVLTNEWGGNMVNSNRFNRPEIWLPESPVTIEWLDGIDLFSVWWMWMAQIFWLEGATRVSYSYFW